MLARVTTAAHATNAEQMRVIRHTGEKPAVVALSAVILLVFAASVPARLHQLMTYCTGSICAQQQLMPVEASSLRQLEISLRFYATFLTVLECIFPLVCAIVAALLLSRAKEPITLYVALMLVSWSTAMPPTMEALAAANVSWRLPVLVLQNLASFLLISFLYVFPDGHAVPRPTRFVIAAWGVWNLVRPAFVQTTPFRPASAEGLVILCLLAGGTAAQVFRFRHRSNARQRQQTKWVVFGLAVTTTGIIAFVLPHSVEPAFLEPGTPRVLSFLLTIPPCMTLASLCLPLSIGVAVLRHGLYDIDVIINRTLVYGALTLMLSAVYTVLVVAQQAIFRAVTGQDSALAVVISTLVIATLFQPLRRHTQRAIDRRFYRRKYSAAKMIAAFTTTLRSDGDLSSLSERLIGVVQHTMEPSSMSLWLQSGPGRKVGGSREEVDRA